MDPKEKDVKDKMSAEDGSAKTGGLPETEGSNAEAPTSKEDAPAAGKPKAAAKITLSKHELDMMDKLKVNTLFKNSKGEYFTTENLAHLSEPKKENVKTVHRNVLEAVANTAE